MIFRVFSFLLAGVLFFSVNSWAFLPEFSLSKEAELGRKFKQYIRSHFPLIQDPEIVSYVRNIVQRLARTVPNYPFKIEVDVVNNNSMNAFATLAGYMVVYSGMIVHVDSDSELAGVLAHELAHLTQRHVAKNIERSRLIGLGTMLTLLAGIFVGGNTQAGQALIVGSLAGGQTALLKYSRDDEREADQIGLNYLLKAGYNPWGMVLIFEKIRRQKWLSGASIPTYMSTHPGIEERINYLKDRLTRLHVKPKLIKSNKLKIVQTLLMAKYSEPEIAFSFFKNNDCYSTLGKGILYTRLNKLNKAKRCFIVLEKSSCKNSVFYREAGIFYYKFGKLNEALNNLQRALLLNPEDSLTMFYYARALAEKGDVPNASKYFQEALKNMSFDPKAHEIVGIFYGKQGKMFLAHLHLAYAYLLEHRFQQFKFHFKKAKSLQKTLEDKKELEKLEKQYKLISKPF
ncbi:MAG: M48 family metalloprotease [Desulfonauticus sp.]|nr:M48 family metalloprotease [Desulfonauticus sp.]